MRELRGVQQPPEERLALMRAAELHLGAWGCALRYGEPVEAVIDGEGCVHGERGDGVDRGKADRGGVDQHAQAEAP
jgi:hypothetical protein